MPAFPTPADPSVQPVARLDCLSWGCPKIAPPSFSQHRSPLPARPCGSAFGKSRPGLLHVPPAWFSTTSTACSSDTARVYCNAPRPWGSPRFRSATASCPAAEEPPRGAIPYPSKPSLRSKPQPLQLPIHANVGLLLVRSPGASPPCCHDVHRNPLPPRPFLPLPRAADTVARACCSSSVP
jgi:hypothetical protein